MQIDLNKLATQARRGDREAAAEMIEALYQPVYWFLRRWAGNDADAADLTQRTFKRVWENIATFQAKSSVTSWVHGIAYHVYLDWRRSNHRTESRPEEWWESCCAAGPGPDENVARWDLAATVYRYVEMLEAPLRECIHLHYYQELTLEETADVLSVASSTIKYRVRQAISELQRKLAQPVETGGSL